jgi:hypothetical protein
MKKIIFGLVTLMAMLGLLLGGCISTSSSSDYYPPTDPSSDNMPSTPTSPPNDTPATVLDNPPPDDVTWISPGKVNVANFYPGGVAEYPITIHNGNDEPTTFNVRYRFPDHVGEGYVKPSAEVQDWVIIAEMTPVLLPRETRDIMVTLAMPLDAVVFAQKWEFWVAVSNAGQTGMVRTEMATRWIVDMRSS